MPLLALLFPLHLDHTLYLGELLVLPRDQRDLVRRRHDGLRELGLLVLDEAEVDLEARRLRQRRDGLERAFARVQRARLWQ